MRALAIIAIVLLAACAKAPDGGDDTPAVRHRAGAWLAHVREAHAAADAADTPPLRQQALAALRMLASGAAPQALPPAETDSVRRDLYAHAAQLALELRYFQLAEELASEGLSLEGSDPFRIQLLIVAAQAYHALGHAQAEAKALQLAREELGVD